MKIPEKPLEETMVRRFFMYSLVLGFAFTLIGCSSQGKKMAQTNDDQAIVNEIKQKIESDDGPAGPLTIEVDSQNGVVLLEGTVPSENAKEQSIAIVKSVDGVTEVRSFLTVRAE